VNKVPQDEIDALARAVRARVEYDAMLGVTGYPRAATTPRRDEAPAPPAAGAAPSEGPADRAAAGTSPCLTATAETARAETLEALRDVIGDCRRCKLAPHRTHLVFGVGNPRAELVFVGEGPGRDEDEQGEPFVGRAGKLLTEIITKGMRLAREDVYIANVVKCRPPENRNPEPDEVESCEPFLRRQLDLIQPRVIVALGKFAVQTLLRSKAPISRLRGQWHDYQGIRLMPTFHPAYLLRNPGEKRVVWEDIKQVMAELGIPVKP
jgi:DNA polymerase